MKYTNFIFEYNNQHALFTLLYASEVKYYHPQPPK